MSNKNLVEIINFPEAEKNSVAKNPVSIRALQLYVNKKPYLILPYQRHTDFPEILERFLQTNFFDYELINSEIINATPNKTNTSVNPNQKLNIIDKMPHALIIEGRNTLDSINTKLTRIPSPVGKEYRLVGNGCIYLNFLNKTFHNLESYTKSVYDLGVDDNHAQLTYNSLNKLGWNKFSLK